MISFSGRGILLDIEGTTASISFVFDVMFPYVRRNLEAYLRGHWQTPELDAVCELLAQDAGHSSSAAWLGDRPADVQQELVLDEVLRQMDADAKTTGLKQLQGMIWEAGFTGGELQAEVFDDVLPALGAWNAAGRDVRIYSSGSIQAQKLFFGHTTRGNLLGLFRGHYDTTTGPKKEARSYERVAADMRLPPGEILFVSDVTGELDAARQAGLQTALCRRPGNPAPPPDHGHPEIASFADIALS